MPSPTSTFRSRTSEEEPARTAAAFAVIPAIKRTIGRGNNFTANLISRAGRRQRVKCESTKNGAGGTGDIEGKAARSWETSEFQPSLDHDIPFSKLGNTRALV